MAQEQNPPSSRGGEASSQPGHGKVSASEIERFIGGIDFPANKQDLVKQARSNDAPQEVLDVMEDFPDRKYNDAADVGRGIGEAKH